MIYIVRLKVKNGKRYNTQALIKRKSSPLNSNIVGFKVKKIPEKEGDIL